MWELGPVKDMHGINKGLHLALVGATVLSAWAFTNLMFALHYAAQYYVEDGSDDDCVQGGFAFPQCDRPGWAEFLISQRAFEGSRPPGRVSERQ